MTYRPPDVSHLGETARQFVWLKDETQAMGAVVRGFGNIFNNVKPADVEVRRSPEPQRMTFTRKGKKRKTKKR